METRCLWRHLQTWSTVTWGPTSHVPVSSCSAARCAPTLPVNRPRPSLPTRNYPNDTLLGHITVKSVTNRCLVHWTQAHIKVHCFPLKLSWKKGGSSLYGIWFINHSNMSYPPVQPGTLSWLVLLSCKSQWKCVKKKKLQFANPKTLVFWKVGGLCVLDNDLTKHYFPFNFFKFFIWLLT